MTDEMIRLKAENENLRFLLSRREPDEIAAVLRSAISAIDHLVAVKKISSSTSTGSNSIGNLRIELNAVLGSLLSVPNKSKNITLQSVTSL